MDNIDAGDFYPWLKLCNVRSVRPDNVFKNGRNRASYRVNFYDLILMERVTDKGIYHIPELICKSTNTFIVSGSIGIITYTHVPFNVGSCTFSLFIRGGNTEIDRICPVISRSQMQFSV